MFKFTLLSTRQSLRISLAALLSDGCLVSATDTGQRAHFMYDARYEK